MENKKKLVIVGDGDTGKTCLLTVFCKGEFPESTAPTTFDQFTKQIFIDDEEIELSLWDTAGQEEYERLRPLSYSDTHVVLMCFAINRPDSLENIPEIWIPEVRYFCPNVPIILVGTKKDLRYNEDIINELERRGQSAVTYEQGEALAHKVNLSAYHESSALNNDGVSEIFEAACRVTMVKKKEKKQSKCSIL